ncbi:hypothetical protein [Azospirillum sp.]|uniref:hypothetical protein n=1 Tax=Azospirillum sp. TaxID=34012 RepID=UPI003D75B02C
MTADVSELIAKLEGATAPNRGLDGEIHMAVTGKAHVMLCHVPAYTASIDAALTLVPADTEDRVYRPTIWAGRAVGGFVGSSARISVLVKDDGAERGWAIASATGNDWETRGATPALALCIAALKSRATAAKEAPHAAA